MRAKPVNPCPHINTASVRKSGAEGEGGEREKGKEGERGSRGKENSNKRQRELLMGTGKRSNKMKQQ